MALNLTTPQIEELSITSCRQLTIDLRLMYEEIGLYGSLNSHIMSGYIALSDGINLTDILPIIGQETLHLKLKSPEGETIEQDFRVYKSSNRVARTDKSDFYILYFVSQMKVDDQTTNLTKCYEGTVAEIIRKIYSDSFPKAQKKIIVEDTVGQKKILIPNWNPFRTILWLSHQAVNKAGNANFLFYETGDSYHVRSFDSILKLAKVTKPIFYWPTKIDRGLNTEEVEKNMAISYIFRSPWDQLKSLSQGLNSCQIITVNSSKKSWSIKEWTYSKHFNEMQHTDGKNKVTSKSLDEEFEKNPSMVTWLKPDTTDTYPGYEDINIKLPERLAQRASFLEQKNFLRVDVVVPGDSSMLIGDLVDFSLPKKEGLSSGDLDYEERYLSGKYLVGNIFHRIRPTRYVTVLELWKDSTNLPLPDGSTKHLNISTRQLKQDSRLPYDSTKNLSAIVQGTTEVDVTSPEVNTGNVVDSLIGVVDPDALTKPSTTFTDDMSREDQSEVLIALMGYDKIDPIRKAIDEENKRLMLEDCF